MDIAKITSKGQVTIPVEIRRKLNIEYGGKILFVEENGRIYIMSADDAEIQTKKKREVLLSDL